MQNNHIYVLRCNWYKGEKKVGCITNLVLKVGVKSLQICVENKYIHITFLFDQLKANEKSFSTQEN